MSAAARDLALHLSKQVQINPDLAYLIGPGSRTFELLMEAISCITGETVTTASARVQTVIATQQSGQPQIIRAARQAYNLAEWISYHFDNQDLSHVDFRVEAKHQADSVIARAGGE